jgi:predicted anti-sigma-YlaC factor YlaD
MEQKHPKKRLTVWRMKMKCRSARKMMSALVDGKLNPAQKESLFCHIQDCDDCRKLHQEILTVHDLFTAAEQHKAPEGFSKKVMAELRTERESCRILPVRIPLFLKLAEIGFAIVTVIVGIISGNILMMNGHSPKRPPGIESSFSLDAFDPAPPDSLEGAYINFTEVRNER